MTSHEEDFSTTGSIAAAPIDMSVIQRLRDLTPTSAFLLGLIHLFLKSSQERLQVVEKAVAASDFSSIKREMHSLASSCGNVGAMGLMSTCRRIEDRAKEEDLSSVVSLVTLVKEEYGSVQRALKAISEEELSRRR